MITIGRKIKELRKKNNLTQEKLAEYLAISFQAVSKWETEAALPDLTYIEPLTRLFHVSADELLGISDEETDARREEFDSLYDKTFLTNDFAERQKICEMAVREYPGDMKYLCNLAWVISNRSFEYENNEKHISEQEKAIKLFKSVIRNCCNENLRKNAILGVTQLLSWRGRTEEAKKYAMMLPEESTPTRDMVWENCLSEDDLIKFKQERIMTHLKGIIWDISFMSYDCFTDTIDDLLRIMIPDGNYLEFNHLLFYAKQRLVRHIINSADSSKYDRVFDLLTEMASCAKEYDKIAFNKTGVYEYSSPLFNHIKTDTRDWIGREGSTMTDDFKEFLDEDLFDVIRERIDLQRFI